MVFEDLPLNVDEYGYCLEPVTLDAAVEFLANCYADHSSMIQKQIYIVTRRVTLDVTVK